MAILFISLHTLGLQLMDQQIFGSSQKPLFLNKETMIVCCWVGTVQPFLGEVNQFKEERRHLEHRWMTMMGHHRARHEGRVSLWWGFCYYNPQTICRRGEWQLRLEIRFRRRQRFGRKREKSGCKINLSCLYGRSLSAEVMSFCNSWGRCSEVSCEASLFTLNSEQPWDSMSSLVDAKSCR